jgi:hypothetical protein
MLRGANRFQSPRVADGPGRARTMVCTLESAQGGQCDTWKQATSYWDTELGLLEF